MSKTMYNFCDRLKLLREKLGLTQSELAKKLSLTRASVNAWEMGISVPSTSVLVELALLFHVSTDYLLGLEECTLIRTDYLTEKEIAAIMNIIECFHTIRQEQISHQYTNED